MSQGNKERATPLFCPSKVETLEHKAKVGPASSAPRIQRASSLFDNKNFNPPFPRRLHHVLNHSFFLLLALSLSHVCHYLTFRRFTLYKKHQGIQSVYPVYNSSLLAFPAS